MLLDLKPRLLLTIEEAAEELRMSPGYVKAQIRAGELPARKLGARTRIERAALETFIANQPPVFTVPQFVTTPSGHGQTSTTMTSQKLVENTTGGGR